jgi:nicotinamide-nucleotide amidase
MRIAIVTTGDELLNGELIDSNSGWLSEQLFRMGVPPVVHLTVGDSPEDIRETLRRLGSEADLALFSGGLGPTQDDHMVACAAEVLRVPVELHRESLERAMAFFAERGIEFSENNRRQAAVPEGAEVFVNPAGLAPAFAFTVGRCRVICLPGVPRELQALWSDSVEAAVAALLPARRPSAYRVLKLFGVAESHLSRDVAELVAANPDVRFGFRAHYPEVWFKMLVPGADEAAAATRADALTNQVRERVGARLFGEGEALFEEVLARLLLERGLTLSTAESCTGGLVGGRLTSVPGSSAWYVGGGITYSNTLKTKLLDVPEALLAEHGAVSEACSRAMAEGARRNFGSDLAVSVTGIAGPDGGTPEKPVGTVHFALATPEGTFHRQRRFRPGREAVRLGASTTALNLVRRYLLGTLTP